MDTLVDRSPLVNWAAGCVMLVWVGYAIQGGITHDFEGFQLATPAALIFFGWVFWRKNGS